jgi:hypothetical protein
MHYQINEMAVLAQRERLSAQAERGYLAEEARITEDARRPVFSAVRRVVRGACVRAGLWRRDADATAGLEVASAAQSGREHGGTPARSLVADKRVPTV